MTTQGFLQKIRSGAVAEAGSDMHMMMHKLSQRAIRITAELNGEYHEPEKLREIFSRLIGKDVDGGFGLFPPFYTDCGLNITIGKNVFINSGCHFQDWGGINVGDGALIGHNVTIATINHGIPVSSRHDNIPTAVTIGKNVWIGSNAVILPGVTVGGGSIIGAGAVVTKDVPENSIAVGVPARVTGSTEQKTAE